MIDYTKYINAGLSVIPIAADGTKSPCVSWKPYQTMQADHATATGWSRRFSGVGICCGFGGVEVIDIDAPELVDLFFENVPPALLERLCVVETPRRDEQGRRGVHLLYRCSEVAGNTKLAMLDDETTLVETRGRGGYVVTVGSSPECHETGGIYEWAAGPDVFHLEEITPAERSGLLAIGRAFDRTEQTIIPPSVPSRIAIDRRPGDEFESSTAWEAIIAPHGWRPVRASGDVVYWCRPGKTKGWSATTGLKSKQGRDLLCVFSSNATPFSGPDGSRPCSTYTKFAAFALLNHGGDYCEATRDLAARGFGSRDCSVDLTKLLANKPAITSVDSPIRVGKFPPSCLAPLGLMSDIIRHTLATSRYPQPELALAAAIALVGTITGRKVTDEFGTRTNVYVLGLDETSTGKEHARQVNKQLLMLSGSDELNGSERVGSHAGIVNAVFDSPALLMQLDEMGRLMATMKDPRKAPHLYNCITVLMQLYSSSGTIWKADAYADSKKVRTIDQPHLCVYGTATPDSFWNNLSTENIAEGLVGRLMVFEGRGYSVDMEKPSREPVPADILDCLRWWSSYAPAGNLSTEHPDPAVIPHTEEAEQRFFGHIQEINQKRKEESKLRAALWSRSGEKVAKLALIHACSRSGQAPEKIEIADVDWAIRLANWLTRRMLLGCNEHVSENEQEARSKRLLQLIGNSRLTMTELTRKTQWLRSRDRSDIVRDLVEGGYLAIETQATGTRPVTYLYRPDQLNRSLERS